MMLQLINLIIVLFLISSKCSLNLINYENNIQKILKQVKVKSDERIKTIQQIASVKMRQYFQTLIIQKIIKVYKLQTPLTTCPLLNPSKSHMHKSIISNFFHQILETELHHLRQNSQHSITAYTDLIAILKNQVTQIFSNTFEINTQFLVFIENALYSASMEIERHPQSLFLEALRLEDDKSVIFYTQLCVRLLDLLYICFLGHYTNKQKKWAIQLKYLIYQSKVRLMFECNDSLDSLLIDFLEKMTSKNEDSDQKDMKAENKSIISLQFLEKLTEICQQFELSYLEEWTQKQKDKMKELWGIKHRKTMDARVSRKNKETSRKSIIILPKTQKQTQKITQVIKQHSHHLGKIEKNRTITMLASGQEQRKSIKQKEILGKSEGKQNFNRRLSEYKAERQRNKSERHRRRTIHQQKFKYTTKNYNQEVVYTFIDENEQLNTDIEDMISSKIEKSQKEKNAKQQQKQKEASKSN